MADFDKAQRRETLVFQEIGRENGKPLNRRMQFNLVTYDGDPNRYIEPRPASDFLDAVNAEPRVLRAMADGVGVIEGFEFYTARPYAVHAFNDAIDA